MWLLLPDVGQCGRGGCLLLPRTGLNSPEAREASAESRCRGHAAPSAGHLPGEGKAPRSQGPGVGGVGSESGGQTQVLSVPQAAFRKRTERRLDCMLCARCVVYVCEGCAVCVCMCDMCVV